MARGMVNGMIWGVVVSVTGVVALSLSTQTPPPVVASAVMPPDVPNVSAPGVDPASAAAMPGPIADDAATPDQRPVAPADGAPAPRTPSPVLPPSVAPASSTAQAGAQQATESEPPASDAPDTPMAIAPDAALAAANSAAADSAALAGAVAPPAAMPPARDAPDSAAAPPGPEVALAPTVPAPANDQPRPVPPPDPAAPASAAPATAAPAPEMPAPTPAAPDPRIAALPEVPPAARPVPAPLVGTPALPLTDRARPAISDGPRAIDRFAAPFDNPDAKPRMAIVLIDRGDSPVGLEALRAFPYPLTFAIDPARADATAAMARYRAAGFEVMALVDLPAGATAPDVEQALAAILTTLPETVAVLDGDRGGLQADRAVADQVSAMLAATGHGAVFLPKGLDTARKLAEKAGVPAATIFRDFDSAGQDAGTIRRFLDQAAFKAGQEATQSTAQATAQSTAQTTVQNGAGVIMLGRLRPETISALLLWGLQDRAARVALAPVSAVLRGD